MQHRLFVQFAPDVVVQCPLERLLEGLHAYGQVRVQGMQPADNLQLDKVVIVAVVLFTDEYHPLAGEFRYQVFDG